jgi:multiple sugar transport system permease protein
MSARDKANRVLIHVILILVSITMLVPFLWMILTAFKTMTEATSVNPFVILPSTWRWDSFKEVIENMDFLHLYINTLLLILGRVVCAVLTATLASIGTAGVPGSGMVMLAMVLTSVGLPVDGIALVAGVDRIFDMGRTTVNITGDASCCMVVTNLEKKKALRKK